MQEPETEISPNDAKQAAIQNAAFEAFRKYGFRRTSMQDIAQGAGMSRAALYLHYRNKEDIIRSLAQGFYDGAILGVRAALWGADTPTQALRAGFAAQTGKAFAALLDSPHGEELLDTKYATSADIALAGEAEITAIYAEWLGDWADQGRINAAAFNGDAEGFAATIKASLFGMKSTAKNYDEFQKHAERLAQVFGTVLTP